MGTVQATPAVAPRGQDRIHLVERREQMKSLVGAFLGRPKVPLAFDLETTSLDPRTGKLVMAQFYQSGYPVVIVDLRDKDFAHWLRPLFDGRLLILGHNLKFDLLWMMHHYEIYPRRVYDTMLAEQVIRGLGKSDAKARGVGLGLKDLAHRYLDQEMSKEERSWFIDLDTRPEWTQPFPQNQLEYGAKDVRLLPSIYHEQLIALQSEGLVQAAKLEMRALPAITTIEQSGIRVNVEGWRGFIAEKEREAKEIESKALQVYGGAILAARAKKYDQKLEEYNEWASERETQEEIARHIWEERKADPQFDPGPWGKWKTEWMQDWRQEHPNPGKPKPDQSLPNLGSPDQLQQAFRELGIAVGSTASEVLQSLEDDHPEVKLLLDYRKATKFVTSFGEALLQYVTPEGRIHPEYVQIGASTGRMSCTRPNWQQVPSKGDGKKLRQLVVAEPGHKLLTADFSNIELRILADITGDKTMLKLFREGTDLHTYTARMMFGLDERVDVANETVPGSVVTYRDVAKIINFGLSYGMSAHKLARTVKVPLDRAEELMAAYFRLYPGVQRWMEETKEDALAQMQSVTLSGRKRYYHLPKKPAGLSPEAVQEWLYEVRKRKSQIKRQGMNTPIQGTSADMTKLALALLYEGKTLQNGMRAGRIVAVVHDEIVIECPDEFVELMRDTLGNAMDTAASTYLHRVSLPPTKVNVAECWKK